ncbi:MAG TPA: amidohydrolase family protein [Candidatus Binatia bacterium]|nr:amidohydrolase family protein [Candidatus Binatia bacterium]
MALPIIDMHVHAMTASGEDAGMRGDPPFPFNLPTEAWPAHDPREPWTRAFDRSMRAEPGPATVWSPPTDDELRDRTLEVMERRNVIGVLCGPPERVAAWRARAPHRTIPAVGLAVGWSDLTPDDLRRLHGEGRLDVLAEVSNQYAGVEPDDERFEPYLAACEELDVPVGIHVGPGPPGAPYLPGLERYRARLHSPLLLEEPLMRHPRLRVYVMHAGWPMLDDMLAILWTHPRVHVDTGVIDYALPRPAFHRYLGALVEAGFGGRILFGSDHMLWPGAMEVAIESIETATFLTDEQRRAILYGNAARFLRLDDAEVARHHALGAAAGDA